MNTKMISNIFNIIGRIVIILWGFLSLIVLFFLVDRWIYSNVKGISNRDIKNYLEISGWLIGILGVMRVLMYFIDNGQSKHNLIMLANPKYKLLEEVKFLNSKGFLEFGVVKEIYWHNNQQKYIYLLEVNGEMKSRRYYTEDLESNENALLDA